MDTLRIVTLSSAGVATAVSDLNDGTYAGIVSGSFKVAPSQRRQLVSATNRRYGGGRVVGEQHDNGQLGFQVVIRDGTAASSVARWESLIAALEDASRDLFIEWRPENVSNSIFYEVRGPATWEARYEWTKFTSNKQVVVEVTIPIGPLGRGAPVTMSAVGITNPATLSLPSAVPGTAPALLDVSVAMAGNTSAYGPMFGLLGWTKRPGSGLASAPFAVLNGSTGSPVLGWTVSGSKLVVTASGSGLAAATWNFDPSLLPRDDFTDGELLVEVWAELGLDSGVLNPALTAAMIANDGGNFGVQRFTNEFGLSGKPILSTYASGSTVRRVVRIGTLPMYVASNPAAIYKLQIWATWSGGSGHFDINKLIVVPIKQRACSPTGITYVAGSYPLSTYPFFITPQLIKDNYSVVKTIRSDLTGYINNQSSGKTFLDAGLSGSVMEVPPGNVDLLVFLANTIPDDPSATLLTEPGTYTVNVTAKVTPRYFLVNPS